MESKGKTPSCRCCLFACPAPQCKKPEALMQIFQLSLYPPLSLSLALPLYPPPFQPSQSAFLSPPAAHSAFGFMDALRILKFSLAECTSPIPAPLLLFLPPLLSLRLLPCHLLSGISSRLAGLAVTLDFKAPLHSSVTHQLEREGQRENLEG